jgi:hypothetical protein
VKSDISTFNDKYETNHFILAYRFVWFFEWARESVALRICA